MKNIPRIFRTAIKFSLLFFVAIFFHSCCIHHKTFAQSDRFDTHRPTFPVVECIPCAGLHNVHEHFSWVEILGPSGAYSAGLELGHNYDHLRIYSSSGISYWPNRSPNFTLTQQVGMVALNPDFKLRPEFGAGLSNWWVAGNKDSEYQLHPSMKNMKVQPGTYSLWEIYGGLRIAVPYSSVNLSLRIYYLETFKNKNYNSFYPGITCGFRF